MRNLADEETVVHLPIGDPPEPDFDDMDEPDNEKEEDEEEDFSDLDALLAEATAATEEEKRLKAAHKRLAHISKHGSHPASEDERQQLVASIRLLEEHRVWLTVGAVALFHVQECAVCTAKHTFFRGWMTEQKHASDPNARRLVAGKPIERLPERREDHFQGLVECCSNCIEVQLAINIATGEAPGEL